ncbi:MAG: peptidylprolyl isomerase [Desulfobulbaceae bacterium]|nr:peptidylprolyl isomerase [Desulfobulbaceae bacterium]
MKQETYPLFILFFASILTLMQTSVVPSCFADSNDLIIASVNNVNITSSQLDNVVAAYKEKAKKADVSEKEKKALMQSLIQRQVFLQQDDVEALRNNEEVVKKTKEYENNLIIRHFLQNQIGKQIHVTEGEIKAYYKENLENFIIPARVVARHILLKTHEDAEKVMVKLKAGEDFGQMARQFSIDLPMALEGGQMGIIEKGKSLPELEKVLFSLKENEISEIVKTKFGYHIITVDKITPETTRSLDQVNSQIRQALLREKQGALFIDIVVKLEKNADIKIYNERIAGKSVD